MVAGPLDGVVFPLRSLATAPNTGLNVITEIDLSLRLHGCFTVRV